MADAATVEDARSFLGKCEELVDEVVGGDVDFVHGEILACGTVRKFRVR